MYFVPAGRLGGGGEDEGQRRVPQREVVSVTTVVVWEGKGKKESTLCKIRNPKWDLAYDYRHFTSCEWEQYGFFPYVNCEGKMLTGGCETSGNYSLLTYSDNVISFT